MAQKPRKPIPSTKPAAPIAVTTVTDVSSPSGLGNGLWGIVGSKTRYSSVIQFSGLEYVRYEYRRIPEEFRAAAAASTFLDVIEITDDVAPLFEDAVAVAAVEVNEADEAGHPEGWVPVPPGFTDTGVEPDAEG